MPQFNLNDYDTVDSRIAQFWAAHQLGAIRTALVFDDGERVVVRADIYRDRESLNPCAVGFAEERRGQGNVNRTSHLENCETSAIGRALANLGYQTKKRPSREEMEKVERYDADPPFDSSAYVRRLKLTHTDKENLRSIYGTNHKINAVLRDAWDNNVETRDAFFDFIETKAPINGLPQDQGETN